MYVCMYVSIYVRTYVCMYVRTYVCTYVLLYYTLICICMYMNVYVIFDSFSRTVSRFSASIFGLLYIICRTCMNIQKRIIAYRYVTYC